MQTLAFVMVAWVSGAKPADPPPAQLFKPLTAEQLTALAKTGNAKNGAATYEVCAGCHLPNGAGKADGAFPQLAGQHATVLVKQLADMRAGVRDNPVMHPFVITLSDQKIADVAAYLSTLPVPHENGMGAGDRLGDAIKLYERDCKVCHGPRGEGDPAKFFPVLAGQHYPYMLRQANDIRAGRRKNANPDMVKVIKPYSDKDVEAVVDYMSRLNMPDPKKK